MSVRHSHQKVTSMSTTMDHAYGSLMKVMSLIEEATVGGQPVTLRMKSGKIDTGLLYALADNKHRAGIINKIAQARLYNLRRNTRNSRVLAPQALREAAAEMVLWSLVYTHTRPIPPQVPLLHHWLPLCYTKAFATRSRRGRGVMVGKSFFGANDKVVQESLVPDVHFAHGRCEKGYYPIRMEKFFAHIEGHYGNERPQSQDMWSDWTSIVMLTFFAVQAARNPEPGSQAQARFHKDHNSHLIQNIFDALDSFEAPHVAYVFNGLEFMFSPFFPPRVRILADGTRVTVYPLSPETAFVVSSRHLSPDEAEQAATRNNDAMVRHAVRTRQPLYGLPRATVAKKATAKFAAN